MKRRVRVVAPQIFSFSVIFLICMITHDAVAQRQFQIRQMRDEMRSKLETYSFGFSWDNSNAYDSLYATYEDFEKLLTNKFIWKNRSSNSIERDYLRLLTNYGLSVLNDQSEKDPLVKLLLEYDPYLIPTSSDNIPDLNNQLKAFYPLPGFKAGIKFGLNSNFRESVSKSYEVVQSDRSNKKYEMGLGWHVGIPISYLLAKNHAISLEPGISYSNVDVSENILGSRQTFKYRIYYVDMPFVYHLSVINPRLNGFKNISAFSQGRVVKLDNKVSSIENKIETSSAGRSTRLERRKNNKSTKRDHLAMNTPYKRVIPSLILGIKPKLRFSSYVDSNNANELTNFIQLDAVAGLGFEWLRDRNTYSVEFRYNYGLLNTNTTERYYLGGEVTGLLFNDFFVSDDFSLQMVEVSFTVNYILNNKAFKIK